MSTEQRTQAPQRLTDAHFAVLDALYLFDDPRGLPSAELIAEVGRKVPCAYELGALANDEAFVERVKRTDVLGEYESPERVRMTSGQYGLRNRYPELCHSYQRSAPSRGAGVRVNTPPETPPLTRVPQPNGRVIVPPQHVIQDNR